MATKSNRLWDYIGAISHSKDPSCLDDMDFEKQYVPFIVNRAFSYHQDSVLAANVMNERPWVDKYLQFRFLSGTLRPRKRYSPWVKNVVSEDVKTVSEYYGCSVLHAKSLITLHTSDQLTHMRDRLKKGGFAPQ
tara:strand:- start:469 stop:870 length:402 start_codon:yes stop_codon:yes gene_type:complete